MPGSDALSAMVDVRPTGMTATRGSWTRNYNGYVGQEHSEEVCIHFIGVYDLSSTNWSAGAKAENDLSGLG